MTYSDATYLMYLALKNQYKNDKKYKRIIDYKCKIVGECMFDLYVRPVKTLEHLDIKMTLDKNGVVFV